MSEVVTLTRKPADCCETSLDNFKALVLEGREVIADGLTERIKGAERLGLGWWDGKLVAVSAIKRPNAEYRDKVFADAQASHAAAKFGNLEMGWSFTKPEYRCRGLCSLLKTLLLADVREPMFATTRLSNKTAINLLLRNGFHRLGEPYRGRTDVLLLYGRMTW
jgi:hypothetical protein